MNTKLSCLILFVLLISNASCASKPDVKSDASKSDAKKQSVKINTSEQFAKMEQPNGKIPNCEIFEVQKDNKSYLRLVADNLVGVDLPKADDWKMECTGTPPRILWAISESHRMQVSVTISEKATGSVTNSYYENLGGALSKDLEKYGLRAKSKVVNSPITFLSMEIDSKMDQPRVLQDTFYHAKTNGVVGAGIFVVLHITTYPEVSNRAALNQLAVDMITSSQLAEFTPKKTISPPTFEGLSADHFSEKSIAALQKILTCDKGVNDFYCSALIRFKKAKALPENTDKVWAGAAKTFIARKDKSGLEAVHYLYVKNKKGAMNHITPTDEAEREELKSILSAIRKGKAPAKQTGLMKYLNSFTPMLVGPITVHSQGLHLMMFKKMPFAPQVYIRENKKEVIAIEIWGEGVGFKIAVFPKP